MIKVEDTIMMSDKNSKFNGNSARNGGVIKGSKS